MNTDRQPQEPAKKDEASLITLTWAAVANEVALAGISWGVGKLLDELMGSKPENFMSSLIKQLETTITKKIDDTQIREISSDIKAITHLLKNYEIEKDQHSYDYNERQLQLMDISASKLYYRAKGYELAGYHAFVLAAQLWITIKRYLKELTKNQQVGCTLVGLIKQSKYAVRILHGKWSEQGRMVGMLPSIYIYHVSNYFTGNRISCSTRSEAERIVEEQKKYNEDKIINPEIIAPTRKIYDKWTELSKTIKQEGIICPTSLLESVVTVAKTQPRFFSTTSANSTVTTEKAESEQIESNSLAHNPG